MIAFLNGTIAAKGQSEVLMDVGGIGFQASCSTNTLSTLPQKGEACLLWIYMSVRDDGVDLYGFSSQEEKRMFLRLTGISGIGPKTALQILGCMPLKDLTLAIMTGDTAMLARAPGIGKKTAQRIALELKDKVSQADVSAAAAGSAAAAVPAASMAADCVAEAIEALTALGYSSTEARNAVSQVRDQSDKPEELIRLALRAMAGM